MEPLSSFETLSRQYLLGELTEAELAAMQQDVFSDQEKFYQLCEIEDRLLEDYARGTLSAEQRRRFEQRYMANPARRRRVEFAQAMAHKFQQEAPAVLVPLSLLRRVQSTWQGMLAGLHAPKLAVSAVAVGMVLLLISAAWLWMERAGLHQKVAQLEDRQKLASPTPTVAPDNTTGTEPTTPTPLPSIPTPVPSAHEARIVNLTVLALALRSETAGKGTILLLPHDTEHVRLRIQLPAQAYDRYAVRMQDAREQEIFAQRDLKVVKGNSGSAVLVTIPAPRLRTGTHLLILDGLADNGEREPVSKLEIKVTRK